MSRYIVLDVVFYAGSLNYDQGTGNLQELKKITKWDGKQYTFVSRYALRYSLLHCANKMFKDKWKLAGPKELKEDKSNVVNPEEKIYDNKKILDFPEFDLFGYMITQSGENKSAITRVAPVKISHALSLTPFNFDTHFNANIDLAKRSGNKENINPFNLEEHRTFYVYNITIDLDRMGKLDEDENCAVGNKEERIKQLVDSIFNLKREIKGRFEDLSPWLVLVGLYKDGKYDTYMDRIELNKSNIYKIITKEKIVKDEEDKDKTITEIEHETVEKQAPKFIIDIEENKGKISTMDEILKDIEAFIKNEKAKNISVCYLNLVKI